MKPANTAKAQSWSSKQKKAAAKPSPARNALNQLRARLGETFSQNWTMIILALFITIVLWYLSHIHS